MTFTICAICGNHKLTPGPLYDCPDEQVKHPILRSVRIVSEDEARLMRWNGGFRGGRTITRGRAKRAA